MIVQKFFRMQRLQFSEHMLNILKGDLAVIITSDDAHLYLDGHVNKHNCRYWAKEIPRELHQKPLHSQSVLCDMLCQKLR